MSYKLKELTSLLNRTLEYYQKNQNPDYVIKPAIPILYFGDIKAYFESKIKIITVGKNPSPTEFCRKKGEPYSFLRFPDWEEKQYYAAALNSYFEYEPYKSWFGSYEEILNGIEASYYSKNERVNRAIHADICSPIATNPTWSKLSHKSQKELFNAGFKLWQELISILEPDIILISIAQFWLQELNLTNKVKFLSFDKRQNGTDRAKPYIIDRYQLSLDRGKVSKVYFGQAAEKPFGSLSNEFKQELGRKILAEF